MARGRLSATCSVLIDQNNERGTVMPFDDEPFSSFTDRAILAYILTYGNGCAEA
jgi:hypothetical protein